jgi:hypothetical protein
VPERSRKVVDMVASKYLPYVVAGVIGAGVAFWAGVPAYALLVLICPVMMFLMMASMGRGANSSRGLDAQPKAPEGPGSQAAGSTGSQDLPAERL